ncbi:MAG: PaaI family thioesterase [Euryarchaeota archaeon]|nr:PaaI family thioesterase [Euryarchaeota archaeon]
MNESPLSEKPEESGVCKSLGITYGEFGKGVAEVHCTVPHEHTNKGGVAHGALFTALLDTALGGALVSTLRKEAWCATAQLSVSFLEAGQVGVNLTGKGRVTRRGKSVAHLAGEVVDESGVVYATATGTWAIFPVKPAKFSD